MPAGSNSGATAAPRSPLGSPASAETPEALVRDSSEEPSNHSGSFSTFSTQTPHGWRRWTSVMCAAVANKVLEILNCQKSTFLLWIATALPQSGGDHLDSGTVVAMLGIVQLDMQMTLRSCRRGRPRLGPQLRVLPLCQGPRQRPQQQRQPVLGGASLVRAQSVIER